MSEIDSSEQSGTGLTLGPLPPYESPTLMKLPQSQRPTPSTVCEVCPASVWFSSPAGLKCFCRVMHLYTWTKDDPNALSACDGEVMAREQREAAAMAGK